MPPPEADVGNRLWRVEQRQADVLKRLEQIETRLDQIRHIQDERAWRVDAIEKQLHSTAEARADIHERIDGLRQRLETQERKPVFGDSKLVQIVIYGLIGLVTALALGKAFVFPVGGGAP